MFLEIFFFIGHLHNRCYWIIQNYKIYGKIRGMITQKHKKNS